MQAVLHKVTAVKQSSPQTFMQMVQAAEEIKKTSWSCMCPIIHWNPTATNSWTSEPVHRECARYLSPPLHCCDSSWFLQRRHFPQPSCHCHSFPQKTLSPEGFFFLLPSPLFPGFFQQQQPLFHSWELLPFKEKDSVRLFKLLWSVCVCLIVWSQASDPTIIPK